MPARLLALVLSLTLLAGCAAPRLSLRERAALAGRVYVVTGASSGFGQGIALALGRERARVVLAARRADLLEEVAAKIRAAGGEALVVPTNVGDADAVERLADAAVGRFGGIDVWINNAGVIALGRLWEMPAADQGRVVDTNLKGVIYGSRAALRRFVAQRRGTLVNMGSVESVVPLAYHSSYAATKAGILSLARSLNQELRHAGVGDTVKVATVMPWAVDTPIWNHAGNYTGRAPRMLLMDGPEKVVEAVLWVSRHPREELPVGWKAKGAVIGHGLMPDLAERVAANVQRAALEQAPPAPATSGNVLAPMTAGRTVAGGIRERRKEREQRPR